MALIDSAVLVPGQGHIWTGTVGTAVKPSLSDLTTFASAGTVPATWTDIGHTDSSDIWAPGQDGGDTDVKGSWQNPSLRQVVTSQTIDFFVVKSIQVLDNSVLSLYYGGGDATTANEFAVPDNPTAQEKACTVVFLDGSKPLALYCPKVSILRDDAIEAATDAFMALPLRFTILKYLTNPKSVWISDALGS